MKALPEGRRAIFKKELKRKALHQLILLYLAAYFLLERARILPLLAIWVIVVLILETLRLKTVWASRLAEMIFGKVIRDKEAHRLTANFYTSLGILATVFLYGAYPRIVAAALLNLTFCDAVSALVGMRFGGRPYVVMGAQRTIAGTLAGFLAALFIGLAMGFSPAASIGAALAFSAVDSLPFPPDDNFWIPVVGATALYFLS